MSIRSSLAVVALCAAAPAWAGYGTDLPSINAHLERELNEARSKLAEAVADKDAKETKYAAQTLVSAEKLAASNSKNKKGSKQDQAKLKSLAKEIGKEKEKAITQLFPLWEEKIDGITAKNKASWTQDFLTDLIGVVPATDKRLAALAKSKGCHIDVKANIAQCP